MSTFTREFAMALAERLNGEGYKLFLVLGVRGEDEDIDVTVVGSGEPQDIDDLQDVLVQLCEELRANIAFQIPEGNA